MRIDAFRPAADFKLHMDKWIQRFRSAKTIKTEASVIIPGDPEREMETERMNNGIPLLQAIVDDLNILGAKYGLTYNKPIIESKDIFIGQVHEDIRPYQLRIH